LCNVPGPTGSVVECLFRRKADGKLYTVNVARGRNALYVVVRIFVTSCVCVCVCVCVCIYGT
jgi:uncharacterized membrane protein